MSLNNGWGNNPKGGNQGPPDLEELWREFNRRLSALLGGRKSGGNNGGNRAPLNTRQFGSGIGLLVALVVLVWLGSGFYIVDASERGVVLQFGKFKEVTEPGPRWHLPWPIESKEIVSLSTVQTIEVGYRSSERAKIPKEALMLTDDENIVSVQFAVQYLLKDARAYLFNNRNPNEAVRQASETAIREIVGKNKMDFVLYEGRDVIAANTQKLIQDILDRYDTGIQIRSVTMQSTQPPEQVQAAFDDAVKASQDKERQKNEGQAYANGVIPRAKGKAARLQQESEGYRARMIATAEGDVARFNQILVEYSKAPVVTRERLYLETLQQIYTNTSKIMVDAKSSGNLLYLPLDKLMQATGTQATAVPETNQGGSAPIITMPNDTPLQSGIPQAGSDYRSLSLSRDRGGR